MKLKKLGPDEWESPHGAYRVKRAYGSTGVIDKETGRVLLGDIYHVYGYDKTYVGQCLDIKKGLDAVIRAHRTKMGGV